jgi:hypothetical protein
MRARLTVGPEDAVALAPRDAEALGLRHGDEVDVFTLRGAFALVAPGGAGGSWFAGSLAALSFGEVAQLVASTLRSGLLLLSYGAARGGRALPRRKAISFRDGRVVFASSSDPSDRLGPVLWRAGLLAQPELERVAPLVRAGRPLGQVLVDEKLLGSAQVYEGIVRQVREIVLGCFCEAEGEFVFREGPHDERNAVRLPERTRELFLAGVRRADEVEALRLEVPDLGAPLLATGGAPAGPDGLAERLLALADGRPLRQAMHDAQLGTYDGLRAAVALVRAGAVAPLAAAPPSAEPAPSQPARTRAGAAAPPDARPAAGAAGAFETYRALLARVFFALRAAVPDAQARLNGYLERLLPGDRELFRGVRVDGGGHVDCARVFLNVNAAGLGAGASARARALEALDGFLAFALFEAKNVLSPAQQEALSDEVRRLAQRG